MTLIHYSDKLVNQFPELYEHIQSLLWDNIIYYVIDSKYRKSVNLKKWLKEQVDNPSEKLLGIASRVKKTSDLDKQVINVLRFVRTKLRYVGDTKTWEMAEHWNNAEETIRYWKGDCVANYEEIYTNEGIKKVGDLKVEDKVLSYDLNKKKFVIKPIIKIWKKGVLPVKRVHLRNGHYIDITDNHPLWVRNNQKFSYYEKKYLKDIDLTRWWKRKLPTVKELKYNIKDVYWLNNELCFLAGHFIADGWHSNTGKIGMSGYNIYEEVIPKLINNEIGFTESKNNSGVPCLNILESNFKNFLRTLKNNSFDIHLSESFFNLPKDKLQSFLDGYFSGDGHYSKYDFKGYKYDGCVSHKEKVYTTSSEQFAKDICRIGLQLGTPFYFYKQENHKSMWGKHPIYRICYNTNSRFSKSFGYDGLSEVSISYIEDVGETEMIDFEVEDTHTFIFKNGLVSHQCEDGAILIYLLCRLKGVPANRIYICAGDVSGGGHAWLAYKPKNYPINYAFLDWCYWYKGNFIPNRNLFTIVGKRIWEWIGRPPNHLLTKTNYHNIWFMFNEEKSFSKVRTR